LQDRRFYSLAGSQWEGPLWDQYENKPKFEVNKIMLAVIRIVNEYRNNRITVDYVSKDGVENDKLAEVCDGLYRADEQASVADEAYDNAFEEAVGGGIGAWRLRTDLQVPNRPLALVSIGVVATNSGADAITHWQDRRLGAQQQNVATEVGDFVLKRADGGFAYQLAVVVDDAAQGITDVVRGEDLADNTARQILLQRQLGRATPRYLHTPLVRDAQGEKLSKHTGAPALDTRAPLAALNAAAMVLGLLPGADNLPDALASWVAEWRATRLAT
jgi:hypothetical protein